MCSGQLEQEEVDRCIVDLPHAMPIEIYSYMFPKHLGSSPPLFCTLGSLPLIAMLAVACMSFARQRATKPCCQVLHLLHILRPIVAIPFDLYGWRITTFECYQVQSWPLKAIFLLPGFL